MDLDVINYLVFKDIVDELKKDPKLKLNKQEDDSIYYNLVNFNSVSLYYDLYAAHKDKYQIYEKFNSPLFNDLLIECAIKLQKENDYEELLFLYAMITHSVIQGYTTPFIQAVKKTDQSLRQAQNMLNAYYAKSNDIDLYKKPVYFYFKNGFNYYEYMNNLLKEPLIKVFKLMSSNEYFKRTYKKARKFSKSFKIKKAKTPCFKIFDIFAKRNVITKDLFTPKEFDPELLNNEHKAYLLGTVSCTDSFDDLIIKAKKEILERIQAFNLYLFDNKDDKLRKLYHLNKERQL